MLGINPGRFGAGLTGTTFADPVVLESVLGIENHFAKRRELSSVLIYDFIERFGGARAFHKRFFLTAMSPLGFTRDGRNVNYYERALAPALTPFIVRSVNAQIAMGGRRDHAIVLGRGENAEFLRRLNEQHGFFGEIHALRPSAVHHAIPAEEDRGVFRGVCRGVRAKQLHALEHGPQRAHEAG